MSLAIVGKCWKMDCCEGVNRRGRVREGEREGGGGRVREGGGRREEGEKMRSSTCEME